MGKDIWGSRVPLTGIVFSSGGHRGHRDHLGLREVWVRSGSQGSKGWGFFLFFEFQSCCSDQKPGQKSREKRCGGLQEECRRDNRVFLYNLWTPVGRAEANSL